MRFSLRSSTSATLVESQASNDCPPAAPNPDQKRIKLISANTFADVLRTSILALEDSAGAFPPLQSTVTAVVALWDIAQRAKHSKSAALKIVQRTYQIYSAIRQAVPKDAAIPSSLQRSIQDFEFLLHEIRCEMTRIVETGFLRRVARLNRNARTLQEFADRLDAAYRDFQVASPLRTEVQLAELSRSVEEMATKLDIQRADLVRAETKDYEKIQILIIFQVLAVLLAQAHWNRISRFRCPT
ncbi:hypothetical protein DFH07DRAFT_957354 [Mycena maculata]|uniref:Uncharacterized protein n=1 Tax=Mycena maculata TaxID=230809 RepID=A0AAD7NHL9_9AGAR|nr:hypothetical protein DFH07DRAFT_957354 [Mycena maculata]